jgi:hypothetical protein
MDENPGYRRPGANPFKMRRRRSSRTVSVLYDEVYGWADRLLFPQHARDRSGILGYMSLISVSCWQHCASDTKYVATQDLLDIIVRIPALDHTNCKQRPIGPCHAESLVFLSELRRKIVWLP